VHFTLDTQSVAFHEYFESLQRAGFQRGEALYLTGQMIAANVIAAVTSA